MFYFASESSRHQLLENRPAIKVATASERKRGESIVMQPEQNYIVGSEQAALGFDILPPAKGSGGHEKDN